MISLASHGNGARLPIDTVQGQRHNFTGAQAQACQQQENRVVTASDRGVAWAMCEDGVQVIRGDGSGNPGHRPIGHRRNRSGEIELDLAAIAQVSKK